MTKKINYNLEERTAKFGKDIISFCRVLSQDAISKPIISQCVRSATSIGANYMEANAASSRKDFRNKIFICKKETQEVKHWLKMIAHYFPKRKEGIRVIFKEVSELTLIFGKILSTLKKSGIK